MMCCGKIKKYAGQITLVSLVSLVGCQTSVRPILPPRKLQADTFQMYFARKVLGPIDLTINGIRVPVEQKKKRARFLTIKGLSQGKHIYFITSHSDVIGPDYGEFEIGTEEGVFQIHFARRLRSELHSTGDSTAPRPEGIPGVTAVLD
jgi:hypothetical protein